MLMTSHLKPLIRLFQFTPARLPWPGPPLHPTWITAIAVYGPPSSPFGLFNLLSPNTPAIVLKYHSHDIMPLLKVLISSPILLGQFPNSSHDRVSLYFSTII